LPRGKQCSHDTTALLLGKQWHTEFPDTLLQKQCFLRHSGTARAEQWHTFQLRLTTYASRPEGFELAALEGLNTAWGTAYTTWDTSSGDLLRGDNAWGKGTGFMDENGKNILAPEARSVGFDQAFTRCAHPAIRKSGESPIFREQNR
jgi:hypothetical protein